MMDTLGPGRILLIGNDEGYKASLCEILVQRNYVVKSATLRENSFRELSELLFDILLIDAETLQVDLDVILGEARKTNPLIGIVIITDSGTQPFQVNSDDDFYEYMVKPVSAEELVIMISRAMRLRALRVIVRDITKLMHTGEEFREAEQYYRLQNERAEKNRDILIEIIDETHESYRALEDLFIGFVRTMANSLDGKRPWKKGHSERVACYALKIAEGIGLDDTEMRELYLGALLHDIGTLGVSDELLDKKTIITKEEFESIKKHSVHGADMLTGVKQLGDIIPIVRHHHERFDGDGYPDGLKGDRIPMSARIIHLADSFDSMTSSRPYRNTPGREYALQELARCRSTQFDPYIAEVALRVLQAAVPGEVSELWPNTYGREFA
jgi:putative nucleotidyltransferase with HDIG domain